MTPTRQLIRWMRLGLCASVLASPLAWAEDAAQAEEKSEWQKILDEAHQMKQVAHEKFEADLAKAKAAKDAAVKKMDADLAAAKKKLVAAADKTEAVVKAEAKKAAAVAKKDFNAAIDEAKKLEQQASQDFHQAAAVATQKIDAAVVKAEAEGKILSADAKEDYNKVKTELGKETKTVEADVMKDYDQTKAALSTEAAKVKDEAKKLVGDDAPLPPPGFRSGKAILASTGRTESYFVPIDATPIDNQILQEGELVDQPKAKEESPAPTADQRSIVTRIKRSALLDEAVPLATLPDRPNLLLSYGDPFFGPGPISEGFEVPTGSVWNPQLFIFGDFTSAVQTFDDGTTQTTEWVNALDVYGNVNFTPTERFLIGFTPLDRDGSFSGYQWKPKGDWLDAINGNVELLFFEGRLTSIFPGLLESDINWNYDFSVGRQALSYQDGLLLDDTIDSFGVTRTSLFLLGSAGTTITGLVGWDNIYRGAGSNVEDKGASLFGLFTQWNYDDLQIQVDMTFVDGGTTVGGDQYNVSVGANKRFGGWLNTTTSINYSDALDKPSVNNDTGVLIFSQLSMQPAHTVDNLYLNSFLGIDNYTSAARGAESGGPLGQTGILFAATGLGDFGPALNSSGRNMIGAAVGYQHYIGDINQQIIGEIGGVTNLKGPGTSQFAIGAEYEYGFWQHFILTLGASVTFQENADTGYGLRSVITYQY
ncbi:hypothetical protein [Cerasicoccus maritimus]|uniref:hypothetical protein n=1 Tax=Cerasicoccus maritimus TaxID=490089 RepID=UPI0028525915|nr:hypothetical protein [Cerasicoccus maritimus]